MSHRGGVPKHLYAKAREIWDVHIKPERLAECLHDYSTQPNEALNKRTSSKAPKDRTYSLTPSLAFRVACSVGEKNDGVADHQLAAYRAAGVYVGFHQRSMLQILQRRAAAFRKHQRTNHYRRRRVHAFNSKSREEVLAERAETATYGSGMGLHLADDDEDDGGDGGDDSTPRRRAAGGAAGTGSDASAKMAKCGNCQRSHPKGSPSAHTAPTCVSGGHHTTRGPRDPKKGDAQHTLRADDYILVFDYETTGLSIYYEEPCQQAFMALKVSADGLIAAAPDLDLHETDIKPRRRISEGASAKHGLTDERVAAAPSFTAANAKLDQDLLMPIREVPSERGVSCYGGYASIGRQRPPNMRITIGGVRLTGRQ